MKGLLWLGMLCAWVPERAYPEAGEFESHFTAQSLRIDFVLSGDAGSRSASLLKLKQEPVWSAPLMGLIDTFGYGEYYVYVSDPVSGDTLYSRGFNTLFEEWRTTREAASRTRAFLNTVYAPYPIHAVKVTIAGRSRADMHFYPLLSFEVDPEDPHIDRGAPVSYPVTTLVEHGSIADHVDLLFAAEGYVLGEEEKFLSTARRFTEALFETPPFAERKERFNVRALFIPSRERGTDIPQEGMYVDSPLGTSFYTFSIDRYLTTEAVPAISDARWNVPCDALIILVNTEVYGGAGIYNFYATAAADNARSPHVFVHELGHSFGGLADEYFTSEVAYDNFYALDQEPWEPNITTLVHFEDKWGDLLAGSDETGSGVFEGGGYSSKGIYRPSDHCMMRDYAPFCPVCSRAIVRMIDFLAPR
ncbi:MAG: IgA Peptidase M64 [Tannerellaceae bacterium]|jgi:hypothetical protein|nr:IgA Peptidase M64 [Tannerellaceae bacterium]